MKHLIETFFFQLACIIIFGFLYWIYRDEFTFNIKSKKNNDLRILECLYTSVTVQAGVGYSILNPDTNRAVLLLMIQQLIMIFSNILMLYLFSKYFMSSKR
jgi:putative flippase GtrA